MKRFFTRTYWLCRREQFIRWMAREYIEAERKIFVRYRQGILAEDRVRDAELARFSKLVKTYGEALTVIGHLHANHPACEIAFRALHPGMMYRRQTGIGIEEFRARNQMPRPPTVSAPKRAALPASPPPSGESGGAGAAGPTPPAG